MHRPAGSTPAGPLEPGGLTSTSASAPGPGRERGGEAGCAAAAGGGGRAPAASWASRRLSRSLLGHPGASWAGGSGPPPRPLGTAAPACGRLENRQSESVRKAGGEGRKSRRGGKGAGSPHAARLPMTKGREGGVRAGKGRGGKGKGRKGRERREGGPHGLTRSWGRPDPSLWGGSLRGRGGTRRNAHHRSAGRAGAWVSAARWEPVSRGEP